MKSSIEYEIPESGDRRKFKKALLEAFRHPGTMRICMSCHNHAMRYYGRRFNDDPEFYKDGWEFCDRVSEAETIRRPTEGNCLWYEPAGGNTTRHTPLVGIRQATYPFWPDPEKPDYEASGPVKFA